MTKTMKRVLVLSACLVIIAGVVSITQSDVVAQIRAALVRDVDQPARQAVTIKKYSDTIFFEGVYTVPAGKELVVEHMNCSTLTTSFYGGIFEGALSHANIRYSVPVIGESAGVLIADGATRLYFNPGSTLNLRMYPGGGSMTCTISGYTVDLP